MYYKNWFILYNYVIYIFYIIIYLDMLLEMLKNLIEYLLVRLFPQNYEYKVIERTNSSGSFVEYVI